MASGCSACISRDRRPATGEARSALVRQVTLAGPKRPSSLVPSGTPDANAAAERSIRPVAVVYRSAVSVKLTSSFTGAAAPGSLIVAIVWSSLARFDRQACARLPFYNTEGV